MVGKTQQQENEVSGLIESSQEAERGTLVPSSLSSYTVEDPTLWMVPHTHLGWVFSRGLNLSGNTLKDGHAQKGVSWVTLNPGSGHSR